MATIDSREIIAQLLRNDGYHNGDPQAAAVYQYRNQEGRVTQAVYWPSPVLEQEIQALFNSPYVQGPVLL